MIVWIIGKNNCFCVVVVVKFVVNWISKILVVDNYYGYVNYWIKGQFWENVEDYWWFLLFLLVVNIEIFIMVMVGMNDLCIFFSEFKQFYYVFKLWKVEIVLVEILEVSYGIVVCLSNLIIKIVYILVWFEKYKEEQICKGGYLREFL